MVDWLEDLKIQRSKQTRQDPYQQYQAHLEKMNKLDGIETSKSVGEMRGKKFKQISQNLPRAIFNQIFK